MTRLSAFILILSALLVTFAASVSAQTSIFTYQGRLTDASVPANASYDMQFKLFDTQAPGTGVQQGATFTPASPVAVAGGIFTVQLDFGSAIFATGANLYLEVSLKPAGSGGGYSSLGPRQRVTSGPFSVRSLSSANADNASNSASLGGVAANQYVQTNDTRLTDARNPLPNSSNYIQNSTAQQAGSNFNISGNGTVAGTLTATFLAASGLNGAETGVYGGTGSGYGVYGVATDAFGSGVFGINPSGGIGVYGSAPSGGMGVRGVSSGSSAYGVYGKNDTSGYGVYGTSTSGSGVYGTSSNTGGYGVYGNSGGGTGVYGISNNANAYGVYGNNPTGGTGVYGISYNGSGVYGTTTSGFGYGVRGDTYYGYGLYGYSTVGIGVYGNASASGWAGKFNGLVEVVGNLDVDYYTGGGMDTVCRNGARLAVCSSSLRYKTSVKPFESGLDLVNRLRPISFAWKSNGKADLGLGAEDVEKVEPLLVTYNEKGEVEGVKYDRVGVVLVNAVKEQQAEIERQQRQIDQQQKEIDMLKKRQLEFDALKRMVIRRTRRSR